MKIPCDAIHFGFFLLKTTKGEIKMIGIYLITNKVNNKVYIGQSNNIDRRIK